MFVKQNLVKQADQVETKLNIRLNWGIGPRCFTVCQLQNPHTIKIYNLDLLLVQMYVGGLFMNGLAVLISNNNKLSSVSVHLFHHTCELLVIMNGLLWRRRQGCWGCSFKIINHSEEIKLKASTKDTQYFYICFAL